jgi:hypothetical protein
MVIIKTIKNNDEPTKVFGLQDWAYQNRVRLVTQVAFVPENKAV